MIHFAPGALFAGAGATTYIGTGTMSASQTVVIWPVPFACTFTDINAWATSAPGASQTYTLTFMKNGAASALACTMSGAAAAASGAGSIAMAAGDLVAIRLASSAGAAANNAFGVSLGYTVP